MLSLLLNVLLLVQFSPNSIASFFVPGVGGGMLTASLDPLQRSVELRSAEPFASFDSDAPAEWKTIALDATGLPPSAIAAGSVFSSATPPIEQSFLAVASGRALRLFAPVPRSANSSSAAAREFTSQPFLSLPNVELVSVLTLSHCICGLAAIASAETLQTKLYAFDSTGSSLSMLALNESRLSLGGSAGQKAWSTVVYDGLIQPASSSTKATAACPPCPGDVVALDAAAGGIELAFSPRATSTRTLLADLDADGNADFIVLSSTSAAVDSSALGLQVNVWRNKGASASSGREQFELVPSSVASGVSWREAIRFSRDGSSDDGSNGVDLNSSLPAPAVDLVATESAFSFPTPRASFVRRLFQPDSHRASYFATTATVAPDPAAQQVVRMADSLALGQFDSQRGGGGRGWDLVVAVTEYASNRSASLSSSSYDGVAVQRRLITLFASDDDPFSFEFDPARSVSDPLPGSEAFLRGVTVRAASSASAAAAFAPLLSHAILLDTAVAAIGDESDGDDDAVVILDSSSLRLLPSTLPSTRGPLHTGWQAYPLAIRAVASPFFDSTSGATAKVLKGFQQTSLALVAHNVGRPAGSLSVVRGGSDGRWTLRSSASASAAADANTDADGAESLYTLEDPASSPPATFDDPDLAEGVSLLFALSSLGDHAADASVVGASLDLGPHCTVAAPLASTVDGGGGGEDLHVLSREVRATGGASSVSLDAEVSPQSFFSPSVPAVSSLLLSDSEDATSAVTQAHKLLAHDLRVAEYYRASGWTEGERLNVTGLQLEHGSGDQTNWWRRIIDSPITWTLLALLFIIGAFFGVLLWRRRARLFNEIQQRRMQDELRDVFANSPPPPIPAMRSPSATPPPLAHCFGGGDELSSPLASSPPPPVLAAAPPNTAALPSSPHANDALPLAHFDFDNGEMLPIPPLVADATASPDSSGQLDSSSPRLAPSLLSSSFVLTAANSPDVSPPTTSLTFSSPTAASQSPAV